MQNKKWRAFFSPSFSSSAFLLAPIQISLTRLCKSEVRIRQQLEVLKLCLYAMSKSTDRNDDQHNKLTWSSDCQRVNGHILPWAKNLEIVFINLYPLLLRSVAPSIVHVGIEIMPLRATTHSIIRQCTL